MSRRTLLLVSIVSLLGISVIAAGSAGAYSQYSINKDATNCAACHGDFRASPYVSLSEGLSWGTDLMDQHSSVMLNGDCGVCHGSGPRFPVVLGSSAGGVGLDPIACAGCHGRAEDGTGTGTEGFGAGLRQHHWNTGTTICAACHSDANPANYTPVAEDILPPYFSDNDVNHPLIPSDPCNPLADGFPEDYAGSSEGLDNDGNNLYDEADTIPCPEPGLLASLVPGIGLLLLTDRRRSRSPAR